MAVTSVLKLEENILKKKVEKYSDILFQLCFPRPVSKLIYRTVYYSSSNSFMENSVLV